MTSEMLKFIEGLRRARTACVQGILSQPHPSDGNLYCNGTYDKFGCWNYTLAGRRAYINCPSHIPGFDPQALAYKDCTVNGSWWVNPSHGRDRANYTACRLRNISHEESYFIYVFIGGYCASIILLCMALFIFIRFRQLRCDRITIHKHLFLSYILNGLMWIIYYSSAVLDGYVIIDNPLWCRIMHILAQYFTVCNFFWMFCEGVYLHTVMVRTFKSGKAVLTACYIIGWLISAFLTGIYAGLRITDAKENMICWVSESSHQWIMYGPIVASMLINVCFLINILRVLLTKLRAMPDTSQTRKAVRATLILIPLLGLQYLLLPIRPKEGSLLHEVYLNLTALAVSLQGSFVATIYCFCNGEVMAVIRRKWSQRRQMHKTYAKRRTSTFVTFYTDPGTGSAREQQVSLRKLNPAESPGSLVIQAVTD